MNLHAFYKKGVQNFRRSFSFFHSVDNIPTTRVSSHFMEHYNLTFYDCLKNSTDAICAELKFLFRQPKKMSALKESLSQVLTSTGPNEGEQACYKHCPLL